MISAGIISWPKGHEDTAAPNFWGVIRVLGSKVYGFLLWFGPLAERAGLQK